MPVCVCVCVCVCAHAHRQERNAKRPCFDRPVGAALSFGGNSSVCLHVERGRACRRYVHRWGKDLELSWESCPKDTRKLKEGPCLFLPHTNAPASLLMGVSPVGCCE